MNVINEIANISYKARGVNLYKFINALRNKGIEVLKQTVENEEYFFNIALTDCKKTRKTAEEFKIELFEIERKGVIVKALKYRLRYGIIIGICLGLAFIFYVSNSVMSIEIKGNQLVTADEILSVLAKENIKKGKFIPDIDYFKAERKLMVELTDLSWVNVQHIGNRILVDVAEITQTVPGKSNQPCNVVAAKDAYITNTIVNDGLLMVIKGDFVSKDQVLISGVYNTESLQLYAHANGKIIGEFTEVKTFTQPTVKEIVEYGDITTSKKLDFFGIKIPFDFAFKGKSTYNKTSENIPFEIFGKKIPIGIIKTEYEEITKKEVTYTLEEATELLEKQVINYEINFLGGYELISKNTEYKAAENGLEVKITYKLKGDIGTEIPLLLK